MNCRKCGNLLNENDPFCRVCGEPVNNGAVMGTTVGINNQNVQPNMQQVQPAGQYNQMGQQVNNMQQMQQYGQPMQQPVQTVPQQQKSNKNIILIIIIILLVAAIGVVGFLLVKDNLKDTTKKDDVKVTEKKNDDKEPKNDNKPEDDDKDNDISVNNDNYVTYDGYKFKKQKGFDYSFEGGFLFAVSDKTDIPYGIIIHDEDYNYVENNIEIIAEELELDGFTDVEYNTLTYKSKRFIIIISNEACIIFIKHGDKTFEFDLAEPGNASSAAEILDEIITLMDGIETDDLTSAEPNDVSVVDSIKNRDMKKGTNVKKIDFSSLKSE